MLQLRNADALVVASTHARGLYTSDLFSNPNPTASIEDHLEVLCVNEELNLSSNSFNATFYQWNFTPNTVNFLNGTNATSMNPDVMFTVNGTYNIELIASNAAGTDITNSTINIGALPIPFIDDFSNNSFAKKWTVNNVDNDLTWETRQVSGATSVSVQNFNYTGASILGQTDDLITPPLDFTGVNSPILNFNYAYTSQSDQSDSLGIFYSKDCGVTWKHIRTLSEDGTNSYNTTFPRNFTFTPLSAGQWCGNPNYAECGYVDLSWFVANEPNVKIMFRNYSHMGNNIYIGGVAITNSSIGIKENKTLDISVYPNPVNEQVTLDFGNELKGDVNITITAINGQMVKQIVLNDVNNQKFALDISTLTEGIYIINATNKSQTYQTKIVKR